MQAQRWSLISVGGTVYGAEEEVVAGMASWVGGRLGGGVGIEEAQLRALVCGCALGWGRMGRPACGAGVGKRGRCFAVGALRAEGLVLWLDGLVVRICA